MNSTRSTRSTRTPKDIIKDARAQLKKALPGWTFSLTQPHYGSFHLNLMSGPTEALLPSEGWKDGGYAQLNHYSLMDNSRSTEERCHCNGAQLTREAFAAMYMAVQIVNSENWDESDSMTDYFHCNYYLSVSVGKWDKPYQAKGQYATHQAPHLAYEQRALESTSREVSASCSIGAQTQKC